MIRTTRQAVLQQIATHPPHAKLPIRILIDSTTLEKRGKFWHLSTPTSDPNQADPGVRVLNGKRGLHLVVLYRVVGGPRVTAACTGLEDRQLIDTGNFIAIDYLTIQQENTNCIDSSDSRLNLILHTFRYEKIIANGRKKIIFFVKMNDLGRKESVAILRT